MFEHEEGNLKQSLVHLLKVRHLDENFCVDSVNIRIAEVAYKLNMFDESLEALAQAEKNIKPND